MLGGLVVGLGGLIEPHALGVGYDNIEALLQGSVDPITIIKLVLVKAVIWSVALGSGTSGGVLAPLLIMGGAIGALFGHIMPIGSVGLWALIGMAAIMGGTMRSPLTSIVFALELTHNMDALLPLVVGGTLAHTTTVLLLRRSILTEKVARRGYHVMREYIVDPFETMRVSEVMASPVETLPADMPVKEAVRFFHDAALEQRHKSYPVVDADYHPIGIVARSEALRWTMEQGTAEHTLGDMVASGHLVTGYDDELIGQLADRMIDADVGRVPILRRDDGKLIGLVARRDLLRVRAHLTRSEREREALLRFGPNPGSALG